MIRVAAFLFMMAFAATGPVWLLVSMACFYGMVFGGVELIVLAAFIDALFMPSTVSIPFYTVGSVILLVVLEFIKPLTVFYKEN